MLTCWSWKSTRGFWAVLSVVMGVSCVEIRAAEPEEATEGLEATLTLASDQYALDKEKSGNAYREKLRKVYAGSVYQRGSNTPVPLKLDATLTLKNRSKEEITLLSGGEGGLLKFKLTGPGVFQGNPTTVSTTDEMRLYGGVTIAPGQAYELQIAHLRHGYRDVQAIYCTEPGEYTLTVTYDTIAAHRTGISGGREIPKKFKRRVKATSNPVKFKVGHFKVAPKRSSSTGSLKATLSLKSDTYTLAKNKSGEAYRKRLKEAYSSDRVVEDDGKGTPKPLKINAVLRLENTSDQEIVILAGGEGGLLKMELTGPGVFNVKPGILSFPENLRPYKAVLIPPGKSHKIKIPHLRHGYRNTHAFYCTEPGEYALTITYNTQATGMAAERVVPSTFKGPFKTQADTVKFRLVHE